MGTISRGLRNAFRNSIRTLSITLILGLSIAMSIVMFLSLKAVGAKIDNVKSSIGNTVTVSPAGIRGFEGGGEALTNSDATTLVSISGVTKVTSAISDHLNSSNTNLIPSMDAGSFGRRQQQEERNGQSTSNQGREIPVGLSMPVMVIGTNDLSVTSNLNVEKLDVSGQTIDANSSDLVAIVGSDLATKNNLTVGSTFKAYGKDVKVSGIFDGGNKFANASFIMPIKTLQTLSGQADQVTSLIVQVNSIDKISAVESSIKEKLGSRADVVSSEDSSKDALAPLQSIKSISLYGLIGSLVAGSIIILLSMVMIVRERRREIGVLKAIGSSNLKIMAQFVVEALSLTFLSSLLGIVLGFALSNPVLKVLINNSSNSSAKTPGEGAMAQHGAMMRFAANGINSAGNALRDLHAVLNYQIILYGLFAAILIAIIGSAIPAYFVAKIRPAEVMRSE